jgi:hypothetical protein
MLVDVDRVELERAVVGATLENLLEERLDASAPPRRA